MGMTGLIRIIRVSNVKKPSPGPKMRPGRSTGVGHAAGAYRLLALPLAQQVRVPRVGVGPERALVHEVADLGLLGRLNHALGALAVHPVEGLAARAPG